MDHGLVMENNPFDELEVPLAFSGFEERLVEAGEIKGKILRDGVNKCSVEQPTLFSNRLNNDLMAHMRVS